MIRESANVPLQHVVLQRHNSSCPCFETSLDKRSCYVIGDISHCLTINESRMKQMVLGGYEFALIVGITKSKV